MLDWIAHIRTAVFPIPKVSKYRSSGYSRIGWREVEVGCWEDS